MQEAMRFIQDNFKQVSVLKERNGGLTEIVIGTDQAIFIRKTIPYSGLPYRRLMNLSCPLLPKIYYVAEEEGNTCVIEQYVDGRNLQDVLDREGPLPEAKARIIGLQLCDALEFLHSQGIIHRDIKPSNIILKEDRTLCLIDFGAARTIKDNTDQDTRILGTPGFAPPEQYGFAATDFRSDFYATGMTLKALLGKDYRGGLTNVIRRCVELDPERRVGSARELRNLLQPHWYDFLLKSGKHKVAAGLAALLLTGGVAFWNLKQPVEQSVPEGRLETQSKSVAADQNGTPKENRAVDKDNRVVTNTDATKETDAVRHMNPDAGSDVAKQSSGDTAKEAPPLVSSSKSESAPKGNGVKAKSVQFSSSYWNVFHKTEQHLGPKVLNADKVVYPPGQWPRITVQNNSDTPVKNLRAVLYFNDFGVVGDDFSVTDQDNSIISSRLTGKGENGVARTVTLRYDGTVAPHAAYRLNLFGGIGGLFKTGANPSVRVVFSADNVEAQEKSYTIEVK